MATWAEWRCQSENQVMNLIIPRARQEQIEALTDTKLIEDLNLQVIHVGSQSKEAGERALHKLDVLRKSFVSWHKISISREILTFGGHRATHRNTPCLLR